MFKKDDRVKATRKVGTIGKGQKGTCSADQGAATVPVKFDNGIEHDAFPADALKPLQ